MDNYYIYIYLDPRYSGQYCYEDFNFLYRPFYVGKGKNKRFEVINGRKKDFIDIINEIKKLGSKPIIIKLYENLSEEQSFELETKTINEIGRIDLGTGVLINKTSGGQGNSGYKHKEVELKKRRKNFSQIKQEFKIREYILLTEESEYKNKNTKLEYICPKNHKYYIRWGDFKKGYGCPFCVKKRINFSQIKQEFKRREYILLTEEKDYKNSKDTKLKYICPSGHEGFIIWNNFQQGKNCLMCRKKLLMGENNPSHKLTEQQVIQIKLLLKEGILTQQEIADMFGVTKQTIKNIKTGKTWSYIK